MFEAIITLCAIAAPTVCRDTLLPGYEAATRDGCRAHIEAAPPDIPALFAQLQPSGVIDCFEVEKIAEFTEIAEGVFVHRGAISEAGPENYGDLSNVGFVVGANAIAVIDSGGSRKVGEEIYRGIRQHSDLPISHVILTHMHPDHVFGASVFVEVGAKIAGHEKLGAALTERSETYLNNVGELIGQALFLGTKIVLPDISVDQSLEINLGDRVLELRSWPTSHTSNDLTVTDLTTRTMFAGDLLFDEHTPALDGSLVGWIKVIEDLRAIPLNRIVPGHGGPDMAWPEGAANLARYLDVLARDTRDAIDKGESLSTAATTIAVEEADNWMLFELFNPRNATVAFTELEWE